MSSSALVVSTNNDEDDINAQENEEEMELAVDLTQLPQIPTAKSLLLVTNFVANTTRFLNHFATNCEERLSSVSNNITRVEILLAILEAKLNSIPDLDIPEESIQINQSKDDVPDIQIDTLALPPADGGIEEINVILPPPPPPEDGGNEMMQAIIVQESKEMEIINGNNDTNEDENGNSILKLKDDPLYAKYFTMRRLGMPDIAITQKMMMDEVDPEILRMDPEGPSPSTGVARRSTSVSSGQPSGQIAMPFPPPAPPISPDSSDDDESLFGMSGGVTNDTLPPPPPPPVIKSDDSDSDFDDEDPPQVLPPPPVGANDDSDSDSDSIESVTPRRSAPGVLKLKDDPMYSKYFAMRKMGLPDAVIEHKLRMDGVVEDILNMDPEGPSPNANQSNQNANLSSQAQSPALPPPPVPKYDSSSDDSDF